MSYSIRPNIPAPKLSTEQSAPSVRRFSYFSKEVESRAIERNKKIKAEEKRILKKKKPSPEEVAAEAKLALERQELINIGKNFSKKFLGLQFDVKNDIAISSVEKFNLEEVAVEQTRCLDNWCSKEKHPESDLFGYDYPAVVNKMRIKSKELMNEYSVPLPRYYHITNGKIGGYYEDIEETEFAETKPIIQYHRIDPIHIESDHIVTMKEYNLNMKLNHIAHLNDELLRKVSKFKRYDLEIEFANIITKYQEYQSYDFKDSNKNLIVYCHDRIKMLQTYIKFKKYFFDINQLLWMNDEVDTYVKLSYYSHSKHKWSILNNFFKTLFRKNYHVFDKRIILAQHPEQIPLEFRRKCDQIVFSFTDTDDDGISKLDEFYKKGLSLITGKIYHISCNSSDFTSVALAYAIERSIIK